MKKLLIIFFTLLSLYSIGQGTFTANGDLAPTGGYPITRFGSAQTGYWPLTSLAERDAIPAWQRTYGMMVYVKAIDSTYTLKSATLDNSNWQAFKQGSVDISNLVKYSDTASLSKRIDLNTTNLNVMLGSYVLSQRFLDSLTAIRSGMDLKLNNADTASLSKRIDVNNTNLNVMLGNTVVSQRFLDSITAVRAGIDLKLNKTDTASLSYRIDQRVNYKDSITKYITPTQLQVHDSLNNKLITAETNRATAAEVANSNAIGNEVTRAKGVEATNASAIGSNTLDIGNEVTRAKGVEANNATAIGSNTIAIGNEVTRATGIEATNATAIGSNTIAIGNEVTRASGVEATNASAIALKANISSPNFTEIPTAPTAGPSDVSMQIANTTFVNSAISTAATPDATDLIKGKILLKGDLSGLADAPTIAVGAITSDKILDGTIADVDLNKAAIPLSGFALPVADISMGTAGTSFKITNLASPIAITDAATKGYVDAGIAADGILYQGIAADITTFSGLTWEQVIAANKLGHSILGTICNLDLSAYTWIAFPTAWGNQSFFYQYDGISYAVVDGLQKRVIKAASTGSVDYQIWFFNTKPNTAVSLIANNN